jgi:hypothetical protein
MGYVHPKRYAGSPDKNQPEICARLDFLDIKWHDVSRLGQGFPDLLVHLLYQGKEHQVLIEVKNPSRYEKGLILEKELRKERLFCRRFNATVAVIMYQRDVDQLVSFFAKHGRIFPAFQFEKVFPVPKKEKSEKDRNTNKAV